MTRIVIQSDAGQELEVEQAVFNAGFFPGYWYVRDAGGSVTPAVPANVDADIASLVPRASGSATSAALRAAFTPKGDLSAFNINLPATVGDGTADDTAAIQTTIDALDDSRGGIVWIQGRCNFTALSITTRFVTLAGPGTLLNGTITVGTGSGYNPVKLSTTISVNMTRTTKSSTVNAIEIRNTHNVDIGDLEVSMYRALVHFPAMSLGGSNEQHSARIHVHNVTTPSWVDYASGTKMIDYLVYVSPNTTGGDHAVGDVTISDCPQVQALVSHVAGGGLDGLLLTGCTLFFETYTNADTVKQCHVDLAGPKNSFINVNNNQLFEAGQESIRIYNPETINFVGNVIAWPGQRTPADAIALTLPSGGRVTGTITGNLLHVPSKYAVGVYGSGNAASLVIGANEHQSISPNPFYYGGTAVPTTLYRYWTDSTLTAQPTVSPLALSTESTAVGDAIGGSQTAVGAKYSARSQTGGVRKVVSVTAANTTIGTFKGADGAAMPYGGMAAVNVVGPGGHGAVYTFQLAGTSTVPATLTQLTGSPVGETSGTWTDSPDFTFNLTSAGVLRASPNGSTTGTFTFDVTVLGNLSFG